MYRLLAEIPEAIFEVSAPAQHSPEIIIIYRAFEGMAMMAEPLRASFRVFIKDFGNFIEEDVRTKIERLCNQALEAAAGLRPAWLAYIEQYRREWQEGAEDELATARAWDVVDWADHDH
jgi:hypothetical protein